MDEEKLKQLYLEFIEARDKYLSSRWHGIRSFIYRIAARPREFSRLLGSERAFCENASDQLDLHICENELTVEILERALLSLELYKSELSGRSVFLVVISIILAVNIAFFNQLSSLIGETGDIQMITGGFTSVLLIVFERSSVARHTHISEQLIILIKNWQSRNG